MSRRTEKPFWDPDALQAQFHTKVLGRRLIVFNRITSTNDFLKRLARRGAQEGTLVLADEQTAGRGRLGRPWQSLPGRGLWFSMLLRPELRLENIGALSLAIAAVVAETLSAICSCTFAVKWPNDILWNNCKICGILCETQISPTSNVSTPPDQLDYVVAGIGINVNHRPEDFAPEWQKRAASLAMIIDRPIDRQKVLVALVQHLDKALFENLPNALPALLSRWRALCRELGNTVTLRLGQTTTSGVFEDIGAGGELILRLANGQRQAYAAGEVTIAK
ncbi:MAG: biotin--[acetyl-CoA-carboxylase] ligase [candidate division KSB1 bacterium]|nr:biotin--[acetyl-CoA-carboxylase] ligase [candidate division KSB1 bacterium]MDZ7304335.1 biotin--[acetyl-CoA-carboxylase] ligase [candidate division KSB1 bacterium]MDZ7313648.1 biotin--[acetyl-CoA-carboxylase] ligase [candidate division KSB1 bacterium]